MLTTNTLTGLIVAAALAGSAVASIRATDPSGCAAVWSSLPTSQPAKAGESILLVLPSANAFGAGAGLKPARPRILRITP